MIKLLVLVALFLGFTDAQGPTSSPTHFSVNSQFLSARTNLREGHNLLGGDASTATAAQATAAHPKYQSAFLKFYDVLGQGHELVEGAKQRLNKVLKISGETFYPTKSPTAWDGVSPTRSPTVAGGNPHTGGSGRANSIQDACIYTTTTCTCTPECGSTCTCTDTITITTAPSHGGQACPTASMRTYTGGACPTCSDGVQNQAETGVDCGGTCTACPTCSDGVQNQAETGVDCGGTCTACPPAFTSQGMGWCTSSQGEHWAGRALWSTSLTCGPGHNSFWSNRSCMPVNDYDASTGRSLTCEAHCASTPGCTGYTMDRHPPRTDCGLLTVPITGSNSETNMGCWKKN